MPICYIIVLMSSYTESYEIILANYVLCCHGSSIIMDVRRKFGNVAHSKGVNYDIVVNYNYFYKHAYCHN